MPAASGPPEGLRNQDELRRFIETGGETAVRVVVAEILAAAGTQNVDIVAQTLASLAVTVGNFPATQNVDITAQTLSELLTQEVQLSLGTRTRVSVGTGGPATTILATAAANRAVLIENVGSATVFWGPTDTITTSGATQGFSLRRRSAVMIPAGGTTIFGVVASGTNDVLVMPVTT